MTGLSYVSIIADTRQFNKGAPSFIPEEHGGLGAFWSAGNLEDGVLESLNGGFGGRRKKEE